VKKRKGAPEVERRVGGSEAAASSATAPEKSELEDRELGAGGGERAQ